MMTLEELIAGYKFGRLTEPLTLDNDQVLVYQDDEKVFEMHPEDLLEKALDLLGIPHEHV